MYNRFELGLRYINYFFSSSSGKGHGIHSPFVFNFVDKVLNVERPDKSFFNDIEEIRQRYEHQHATIIEVEDLGAGSFTHAGRKRTVSQIVRGAAKNPKLARLLYRIVRHYKIDSVLELGTSLGLTTRYLSRANPTKGVQTIEGATGIANFTEAALINEGIENVDIHVGDFIKKLPFALSRMEGRKLVFFDGNHQYAATIQYFQEVLNSIGEEDVLVFDDIHWSRGMEKAWQEIKKNERVACSIDLFFIGIVFFRKEFKEKLDFTIRF